jgi:hypothetical protein
MLDDILDFDEAFVDRGGVAIDDFFALMPSHSYIFAPTREVWAAASVNARVPPIPAGDKPIPATHWLDQNRPVEQMTWCPGLPMIIQDRLTSNGGWIERTGVRCFNLYQPPTVEPGDATLAQPWVDHVKKVFGEDAGHIIRWLAQRVQHPQEKINHGLVLGGAQGIGKDTILEPVKCAIGPWNFHEISPTHLLGRFNGFVKSVILRVNEARDLGDGDRINRFSFYDHTKMFTAAPPDVLRVDEKHLHEYYALNCLGFVITTNHKSDGIYLPADDRRHYVAWSDLVKEDFPDGYWNNIWGWYAAGGMRHVAAYLREADISDFDPKAPPLKTAAFWDIVGANSSTEDAEIADVLERLKNPDAVTLRMITSAATGETETYLRDRRNRRSLPYRMERCGYVPIRHETSDRGFWKIDGVRQVVYAKAALSIRDRFAAAKRLAAQGAQS